MSTRPASPPSVARWNFWLGAVVFLAVAIAVVLLSDYPPGAGTLTILMVCLALSVLLTLAPFLLEYDARVRVAEAHARDHAEQQMRRLSQAAEQLSNAIARSQAADEQAGQALGTLEELAEKVTAQAEELAQSLARSQEREIAALKTEMERLNTERDDRLGALDQRLDTANGQLSELQLNLRKQAVQTTKALDELKERLIALASRLDDSLRAERPDAASVDKHAAAPTPATTTPDSAGSDDAGSTPSRAMPAVGPEKAEGPAVAEPPAEPAVTPSEKTDVQRPKARSTHRAAASPAPVIEPESSPSPTASSLSDSRETDAPEQQAKVSAATPPTAPAPAAKPRVRRSTESTPLPPSRISAKPQPLDLPLLDLPPPKPAVHRDASGGTSTLVATAYIGIGNKLYVRGDGPGLSWDQGVPMQFLAIGKWGWTSPSPGEPITCKIYRNDETPMLDENIVIEPGAKAEVTPRF